MSRPIPPPPSLVLAVAAWCSAAALLFVACGTGQPSRTVALPEGGAALPATVVKVIDGDTVELDVGGSREHVRLLGIDTPETVKPNHPVDCWGPEASARTKALLPPDTPVLIQRDEEARDRYGRLLVYLWRHEDGLFVNRALAIEGNARTLSITPNTAHRADFSAAVADAKARGTGLWAACSDAAE